MSAQFIEEWNSTIQFKLSATSLQQPNETFLFSALSSLLHHININVDKMSEETFQNEDQRHRFRIEFCHYIDMMVKISNPKESFCYFDLVCPVPKKTTYLLKLMLNFYSFYKVTRDDVIGLANEMVDAHDALITSRNNCLRDKEKHQKRMDNINQQSKCVAVRNAELLQSIEERRSNQQSIEKKLQSDQKKLSESKLRQLEMEQRLQELTDLLVTEDEAKELENLHEHLNAELDVLATNKRELLASHRDVYEQTGGLADMNECANRFLAMFTVDAVTAKKNLEVKVAKVQQEIEDNKTKLDVLVKSERVARTELDHVQQFVDDKTSKLSKDNQSNDRELIKLKREKEQVIKRQAIVDDKMRTVEAKLLVAETDRTYIIDEAPKLLRTIAHSR